MKPFGRRLLGVACIALVETLALVSVVALVELSYTGPHSVAPALGWAVAILWFPLGYIPEHWLAWAAPAPPTVRILTLAAANGLIWGVTIVAIWMGMSKRFGGGPGGTTRPSASEAS
jgi:hypothetical protein